MDAATTCSTSGFHQHLPKLDTVGFVDRDPDAGTIEPGPHYEVIDSVGALLETHQDELRTDWP